MRILDLHCWQPVSATSPPDWRTSLGQIAVRIETDEGLIGFGVGGGGVAALHVIEAVLRPLLIGRESEPVESLWEEMYRATLPFGRRGLAVMAISGVDLALWDVRARRAGVSVAALLNPAYSRSVPVYRTCWEQITAEALNDCCGVKLHLGVTDWNKSPRRRSVAEVVHEVEVARTALGNERSLMLDAWMQWDVDFTLQVAKAIQGLGIAWIEEPLPPDDLAGYALLVQSSPVPIAGGEHEFTRWGFEPLISGRLHHVLQPDVCWAGGMTELVRLYQRAQSAGLRVVPHRGAEVWGLHAMAALDSAPLAEAGRPWVTWVRGQPEIEGGLIGIPDQPGFGVVLDSTDSAKS